MKTEPQRLFFSSSCSPPARIRRLLAAFPTLLFLLLLASCSSEQNTESGDESTGDDNGENFEVLKSIALELPEPGIITDNSRVVEDRHRGETILVRQVNRATRESLGFAAFENSPLITIARQLSEEDVALYPRLSTITLEDSQEWQNGPFIVGSLSNEKPTVLESEEVLSFTWDALSTYLADQGDDDLVIELEDPILAETWGAPVTSGPQNIGQLFFVPGEDGVSAWVRIDFRRNTPADASITDSNGDGLAEVFMQISMAVIDPAFFSDVLLPYATESLGDDEAYDFLQGILASRYPELNAKALDPAGLDAVPPADYKTAQWVAELGDAQLPVPQLYIVRTAEEQIYHSLIYVGKKSPENLLSGTSSAAETVEPMGLESRPVLERTEEVSLEEWRKSLRDTLDTTPQDQISIPGEDGFIFLRDALRYLATEPRDAADLVSVRIIIEIAEQIKEAGGTLVFVPIPAKATIYPEFVNGKAPKDRANPQTVSIMEALKENGVQVVDLYEDLRSPSLLFLRSDTHWNPRGISISAQSIAKTVSPQLRELGAATAEFTKQTVAVTPFQGDLVRTLPPDLKRNYDPVEVTIDQVRNRAGELLESAQPDSSVTLIGDSYVALFQTGSRARSGGLASQMSYVMNHAVENIADMGGGPGVITTLEQLQAADPDYLKDRIIVWAFTERVLLNEEGWRSLNLPRSE